MPEVIKVILPHLPSRDPESIIAMDCLEGNDNKVAGLMSHTEIFRSWKP